MKAWTTGGGRPRRISNRPSGKGDACHLVHLTVPVRSLGREHVKRREHGLQSGNGGWSARKHLPDYEKKVRPLRDALEEGILGTGSGGRESAPSEKTGNQSRLTSAATKNEGPGIPNTELNGHKTHRLANTTNITFHGIESEALLILLDQAGICASSGSACLADSDEPSHVVKAMKPGSAASRQMIRFSLGLENTAAEIKAALSAIEHAVKMLRG